MVTTAVATCCFFDDFVEVEDFFFLDDFLEEVDDDDETEGSGGVVTMMLAEERSFLVADLLEVVILWDGDRCLIKVPPLFFLRAHDGDLTFEILVEFCIVPPYVSFD